LLVLTLAQGGERDQFADVGATGKSLADFCVKHVLELVWGNEEAHGVCVWFGCGAGGSASRQNHSSARAKKLTRRKMIKNLKQMPDIKDSLMQGVTQGFNTFQNQKAREFTGRNSKAYNFLKAFLGTGALQFEDNSGSVSIDPRTGAFSGTPKNPEGFGFSINPLTQSASIRKGPFELSGGLRDAPISMATGYGPTNEQLFNFGGTQKNTPWGMIGFKFGGKNPEADFKPEDKRPTPRINLYTQSPEKEFANQSVKELLDRTTGSLNSGRDLYNPATW